MQYKTNNFDGPSYAAQQKIYVYFQAMSNELNSPTILVCPDDAKRTPGTNFTTDFNNSNISYFVGMDADETRPEMFLAGDRNYFINDSPAQAGLISVKSTDNLGWTHKIHQDQGNVGLADGSVQQYTSSGLQQALRHTGTNVNRLAVP